MTTVDIKVVGHRDESLKQVNFGTINKVSVSDAIRFSTDRAVADYQVVKDLEEKDVIELIFEGDIHRFVTVEELERDFKNNLSRGSEPGVLEIPSRLPTGDTTRGATSQVLEALRVLKFDPVKEAAKNFAEFWDSKIMREPGLYRFDKGFDKRGEKINQIKEKSGKPILLFIHGTFSQTATGFGGLTPEAWTLLQEYFGSEIYGYDHYTLSKSPIENAVDLAQRLPPRAKLHIVTHSRGGLIGELLCRSGRNGKSGPFDKLDQKLIGENAKMAKDLDELTKLLSGSKKISVERFVRVACPARGTTLASKRVDRWLEIIINVARKLIPKGTPWAIGYDVLTDLLLDFKKQGMNPEAIPGLAVMDPESSFIKMINRADLELDVDLSVIAGDIEKTGIIGKLAVFFTDLFYSDDHDLAVQTTQMYGGPRRKHGRYFFHKGPGVWHSSYFSLKRTADIITDALTLPATELGSKGFRPLEEAYIRAIAELELTSRSYQMRSNLSQPVVYILPGIMGTHLGENGDRFWLDVLDLAQGKIANLGIANRDVEPQALVGLAYGNLVEYLSATHEVIPFPYDWRLSILDEAQRFANVLEAKLKATRANQPIRIIAHGMGGLVTRAMIGLRPDLWEKISQREGARFIMLGTPNGGSYMIPRLIFGQEKTFRMLAMLDLHNSAEKLLEIMTRFPGVLQLLPMGKDSPWNFLAADTWDKFPNIGKRKWVKPLEKDLEQVKRFREVLEAGNKQIKNWDSIIYVAGCAPRAPVAVEVSETDEIVFRGTNQGDGTVPWESGILPELEKDRTYYMNVPHGDLANHRSSFSAIYDLLNEGITTQLSKTAPIADPGEEDNYPLSEESIELYPHQMELESTVLGITLTQPSEFSLTKAIKVSVAHGNLAFCSFPVAVGHYESDGLYSAEKAIDYHLNGRLSVRHSLGLYPGPAGTVEVLFNDPGHKPRGAIIIGLGTAGELSSNKLAQAISAALSVYGMNAIESGMVSEDGKIAFSALLIGTGGVGLSIANSIDAIINGALQANKVLAKLTTPYNNIHISEIQFVELYQDKAILAAKALEAYFYNPNFLINPRLHIMPGGWVRLAFEEDQKEWWNRIHIRAGKDHSLIFTIPTERARSEEAQQGVQSRNIDGLIAQAVGNPNWDQSLATTLFELTIPNWLKGSFRHLNNILLVVDKEVARYPWEMIYDRRTDQDLPLAIQVGLIRQFNTPSFRENILDVKNKNVLVIGEPDDVPSDFPDLPGARNEAIRVADIFEKHGFEVRPEIQSGSNSIMNSLFSDDYRVLHLAGHGVFEHKYKESVDSEPEIFTGMVLGNGVFLTANEIKQKMNIPELVFINCCHLGKVSSPEAANQPPSYPYNEFAASLSKELIEMGVKAVIAAGWAVDDVAALTFAEQFYSQLLRGDSFGSAVNKARRATYTLHKDKTNTWAAYQCYGNPAYRLVSAGQLPPRTFSVVDEVILEINRYRDLARTTSALGIESIRGDLRNFTDKIERDNPTWLNDASVLEALGEAFGEVFWFEEAVKYYDLAIESGQSTAAIKTIERSANFSIRLAVQECENDPEQYIAAKNKIEKQIKKLKRLMSAIGETAERLSMVGSGYKRLAQLSGARNAKYCTSALREMEKYYYRAWEMSYDAYPLTNALTTTIVQMLRARVIDISELPDLKKQIDDAEKLARKNRALFPDDFWAATGVTDIKMLRYLYEYLKNKKQDFETIHDELVEEYKTSWKQYGSARELNSIIEHYAFLAAVIERLDAKKKNAHEKVCQLLKKISNSLKAKYEAEVD